MQSLCLISILILFLQVRDVLAETTMAEDVVLRRIHVMKVKETVMDLAMEARMMDTKDVNQDWFVDQIIARSLASTTMRRMTAVIYLEIHSQSQNQSFLESLLGFP